MSGMYDKPTTFEHAPLTPYKASPNHVIGQGRIENPVDYLNAREQRAREMQIEIESIKLLRREVITCYRKEGVNHYMNCREQVSNYMKAISDPQMLAPRVEKKE